MELVVQDYRDIGLVSVLHIQRRTVSTNIAGRTADIDCVADFRSGLGKFVRILALDTVCNHQFVFKDDESLIGDIAHRQELLGQRGLLVRSVLPFVSLKLSLPRTYEAV